ncbi:hypothetical protein PoB_006732500 [Plakobranchus ocellatus]|uniref:Uncharacterized protein n=1 Tax=Plakobranchus ocellatus TaxID=259542 RepID=A0AAV4D9V6_9GAST|nr:hypothetical protein PoB_006732500 [Plakobranchus ocellatus]
MKKQQAKVRYDCRKLLIELTKVLTCKKSYLTLQTWNSADPGPGESCRVRSGPKAYTPQKGCDFPRNISGFVTYLEKWRADRYGSEKRCLEHFLAPEEPF